MSNRQPYKGVKAVKKQSNTEKLVELQEKYHQQNKPNYFLYLIMLGMLVCGTFTTIITKLQDEQEVTLSNGKVVKFDHPYFQCAIMFVGELLCLVIYAIKQVWWGENQQQNKTTMTIDLLLAIPAIFDIIATSLMFVGLTMVAGSVFQMMRGFIVVITAFFALIFLGRKQFIHHWVSILTIVAGIAIVGFVSIYGQKTETDAHAETAQTSVQGIVLILIAQCFVGAMMVVEEKLLSGTQLDPMYVVGMEGFWGCLFFGILLPIFQSISCEGSLCHEGKIEDTLATFAEMRQNPIIMYQFVGGLLLVAFFNSFGVMITKHASAAQRATIDACRTLTIWVVFIMLGKEKFNTGEMIGFMLLVTGTLVYNEILEIPIDAFQRNTKRAIAQREEEEKKRLEAKAKQNNDTSITNVNTQATLLNEDEQPLMTSS